MTTWRVFAGRWTEKRYQCTFVCMGIQCNASLKATPCEYTVQNIVSSFIQMVLFVKAALFNLKGNDPLFSLFH